ncbi:hypothetical protein O1W68_07700 [Rhodococcus sp. H36-A4]|uniref:hypothetical protein n=1 Tax=Rhodococcus sp. H36-A4 TaxID=3004353 RepID=UPI0022AF36E5|nr:hypothetical protein [Rhodococcus sp. H36-A4]MCZ4077819.1 hypothetical protein [Rhodococcus sp. H36-A4]
MRISEKDRQRATAAITAVKRGDNKAFNAELNTVIKDGGIIRFTYALAELAGAEQ